MTKIKSQTFNCPKCSTPADLTMYDSVNVTLQPDLKDKVMDRSLFSWKCPTCGQETHVIYDFLYHDMDTKLMLYFTQDCEQINNTTHAMLEKFKGMRVSTYRSTSDYDAFIEKILIFDAGLDDIVMEFAKLAIVLDSKNNLNSKTTLRFRKVITKEDGTEVLCFNMLENGTLKDGYILLEMDGYKQYSTIVAENPNLRMTTWCETIDKEWIKKRLRDKKQQTETSRKKSVWERIKNLFGKD